MFCENCGTQLLEGAKFCGSCGAKIEAPQPILAGVTAAQSAAQPVPPPPPVAYTPHPVPPAPARPQSYAPPQPAAPASKRLSGTEPLGVGQYIKMLLLMCVPILNLVLLFMWSFGGSVNLNKKNFARASLILGAIGLIFFILAGGALGNILSEIAGGMY